MNDSSGRELETARLRMRPIAAGDLEALARLHGDPEIMAGMRFGAERPAAVPDRVPPGVRRGLDRCCGAHAPSPNALARAIAPR